MKNLSRLARDYNGEFGEFWQKKAQEDLQKHLGKLYRDEKGCIRWNESNNAVPTDILELLSVSNNLTDEEFEVAVEQRSIEVSKSVAEWKANYKPSSEQRAEMRAAFGAGTKVVNVLTGKTITV